ncbi:MAG: class I SAM-dependent methyltransferase [Spirochaetales bacterium]|nr:class I SAM-dependent methyltransferase [Spirochaetales bacterium]
MDNGKTSVVVKQFDIISKLPDLWDHNRQYHHFLLKHLSCKYNAALDIGCGTGEFTRALSPFCKQVIGIDVSESMIGEAKKRNPGKNISYIHQDIESYLENSDKKYDIIASIATFHHLDQKNMLRKVEGRLKPGGLLLILDLYQNQRSMDYILSGLASVCNPFYYLFYRGTLFNTKAERAAWENHIRYDEYLSIKELKRMSKNIMNGAKLRRHLFWRYSLVYRKCK